MFIKNNCMTSPKPQDIDEYIAMFPPGTRDFLEQIRATIRRVVPAAVETISYGMPAFNLNGTYLIYFAAYKKHIGLYPVPNGNDELDKEFASYKTSGKGTIQFPLSKPMPIELITKIVMFRVKENIEKVAKKKQRKKRTNS